MVQTTPRAPLPTPSYVPSGAPDLGAEGERRVARSRLIITGILAALSLVVLGTNPGSREALWGSALSGIAALVAAGILIVARRDVRPASFALVTCLYDVSFVSLLHVIDLLRDHPSEAVNGRVTFSIYFLALAGTIVRWDRRVCVWAGMVAAVQYMGIAVWSAAIWPSGVTADITSFGLFDWGVQVERAVTLLLFAGICHSISKWASELRFSATRDALTGLLNRSVLEERLHDEILRARRQKQPLSVAMIDVDHFKEVNDRHGHHAGDEALRAVARYLRLGLRRTDLLARWGGEEFAIVFPETSEDDAFEKVERMRAEISAGPMGTAGGGSVMVTISAGIACLSADCRGAHELLQAADFRLLSAKRSGRNRVKTQELAAIGA